MAFIKSSQLDLDSSEQREFEKFKNLRNSLENVSNLILRMLNFKISFIGTE
jgi:hypothetical protein